MMVSDIVSMTGAESHKFVQYTNLPEVTSVMMSETLVVISVKA